MSTPVPHHRVVVLAAAIASNYLRDKRHSSRAYSVGRTTRQIIRALIYQSVYSHYCIRRSRFSVE